VLIINRFIQLVRFTEERFVNLLPPKDKKRYLALTLEATTGEVSDAEHDILLWQQSQFFHVNQNKPATKAQALPPVRGSSHKTFFDEKSDEDLLERPDHKHYKILNSNQNMKLSELRVKLKVSQLSSMTRKAKGSEHD
jgi:hypothetical protein